MLYQLLDAHCSHTGHKLIKLEIWTVVQASQTTLIADNVSESLTQQKLHTRVLPSLS